MDRPLTDPVLEALAPDGSGRWFIDVIENLPATLRYQDTGLCIRCAVMEELRALSREGRAVLDRRAGGWRRVLH